MNRYRVFFAQTSTRPPTHAPKVYQTWKQNNQLHTQSHDELKDNSIITRVKTQQSNVEVLLLLYSSVSFDLLHSNRRVSERGPNERGAWHLLM